MFIPWLFSLQQHVAILILKKEEDNVTSSKLRGWIKCTHDIEKSVVYWSIFADFGREATTQSKR